MKMEAWQLVQNAENAVRMGLEEARRKRSECEQEMEVLRRQAEFQTQLYLQQKEMVDRQHQAVQQLRDASQRKEQECHYLESSYEQLARAFQTFAPARPPPFPVPAADHGMGLSFSNDSCAFGAQLQFSSLLSEQSSATAEALSPAAVGVLVQAGGLDAGAPCHGQHFVAPAAGPALNAAPGVLPVPACVKTEAQQQQWRPGVEEYRVKRRRRGNLKTGVEGIDIISLSSDESSDEQPVGPRTPVPECLMLSSDDEASEKQRRVAFARRFTQAGVGAEGCGHGLASVCKQENASASGREDMGVVEVPTMRTPCDVMPTAWNTSLVSGLAREARASASQLPYLSEGEMRHMGATGGSAEEAATSTLLVHGIRQDMDVAARSSNVGGTISPGLEAAELAKQVNGSDASCVSETQSPANDSAAVLGDSVTKGLPGATSPVGRGKLHREDCRRMAGRKKNSRVPHMHLKKCPPAATGEPHPEGEVTTWGMKQTRTGQVHAAEGQLCSGMLEGRDAYEYLRAKEVFLRNTSRRLADEVLRRFPDSPVVIRSTKPADFHLKSWSDVGSLNSLKFQRLFSTHSPQLAAKLFSKSLQSKAKTTDPLHEIGEIANAFQPEAYESAVSNSRDVRGKVKHAIEVHVRSCKKKQDFRLTWPHHRIVAWETKRLKILFSKDREACSDYSAQDYHVREKPPAENGVLPQGQGMVGHCVMASYIGHCVAKRYKDENWKRGHVVHYSEFDGEYVVLFEDGKLRSINNRKEKILLHSFA